MLLYLAAAGVERWGLSTTNVVSRSNLQRQVLFATDDIGSSKVERGAELLGRLNPNVMVHSHAVRFAADMRTRWWRATTW